MRKGKSSRDSAQETRTSNQPTTRGGSHRPCGKIRRFLGEVKDNIKDGVNKLRTSRSKDSSSTNIKAQVEVKADTQSALQDALQAARHMHPLWGLAITAFSPDGTRIVTGSSDKTVRLWDTAMWQPVGEPLWGHTHSVSSLSLSPDGTHIVTGSDDNTVRLCDAAMKRPSQQYAVSDPLAFSDEHHIMHPIESTNNMTLNNHFIRFSSNSIHALRNTSELTEGASHDDRSSTPFLLNRDSGWMMEHTCQMLFWVPPAPRHTFCSPQTALVIHRGGPELDLSSMAHGQHWQQCRD